MSGPPIVWLLREVVEAIHDEQIAWHGGQDGTRDAGLLESALARPRNIAVYDEPDLPAMAASLGYGLARTIPSWMATSAQRSSLSRPSCCSTG